MATKFYLPSSGSAPITPAYDAAWTNTTFAARLPCHDSKQSTAMATVADTVNIKTNEDHLYRQWISEPIASQTLSAQTVKVQIRAAESNTSADLFLSISIRVVSNDGNTVRGTVLTLVRDGTEFASTLTNRGYSATSTEVVASANDRIVIEIGQGGDPAGGGNHNDGTLRIGDNSGTDLPEDDSDTNDYNPWVEFANTITWPSPPDELTADDISSGFPQMDSPILERIHNLVADDITSGTPTLEQPTLEEIDTLTADDITAGTPTLEQPTLSLVVPLTADDISSGCPQTDSPILERIHNLTADDITSATPTLDTPTLAAFQALDADDITSGTPTLDSPVIAQIHALDPDDISSGCPQTDSPILERIHNLVADDIASSAPTLDAPTLAEAGTDNLTADDITAAAPTLDSPTIGQIHALAATDLTSGTPTLDAPFIDVDALTANDITSGTPQTDSPLLAVIHNLTANDVNSGAPLFDSPIFQAHYRPPAARTATPILATLISVPPSAQRTSVPY